MRLAVFSPLWFNVRLGLVSILVPVGLFSSSSWAECTLSLSLSCVCGHIPCLFGSLYVVPEAYLGVARLAGLGVDGKGAYEGP